MLLSRCYHPAFTDSFTEFCAGYSSTGVRCNASSRYIFWYIYEPPWNLYPQLSEPLLTMCFPMRLKSRAFLKQSIPWDVKNSIYLPADRFLLKKPLLTIPPKQLDIWPKCQHCSVEHFTLTVSYKLILATFHACCPSQLSYMPVIPGLVTHTIIFYLLFHSSHHCKIHWNTTSVSLKKTWLTWTGKSN